MNKETSQPVYNMHCLLSFSPDFIPHLLSNKTSLKITGCYQDSLPFQIIRVWLKDWNDNTPNWNTFLDLEQIKLIFTLVDFCPNKSHIKILRFGSESTQRITGTTNEVPGCLSLINLWHPVVSVFQWFGFEENNLLSQH